LRYSRHILLPELGIEAQEKFAASHALVVGAGGLGAPVAQFLAASGIGTMTLADPDTVDLTNLQRQILYASPDVGQLTVGEALARSQQFARTRATGVLARDGDHAMKTLRDAALAVCLAIAAFTATVVNAQAPSDATTALAKSDWNAIRASCTNNSPRSRRAT